MAADGAEKLKQEVASAVELVAKQGDIVRSLKAELKDGKLTRVSHHSALHDASLLAMESLAICDVAHPANRLNPFPLQADIDEAIEKLKNMKIDMEKMQKASAASPPQCFCTAPRLSSPQNNVIPAL
jgi:hypothetical protein